VGVADQVEYWSLNFVLHSYGEVPYTGLSNLEATEKVLSGYMLPKPTLCPDFVYELMKKCWLRTPKERPNFEGISDELSTITKEGYSPALRDPSNSLSRQSITPQAEYN